MNCCSCAPLAVETIYNKVDELEKKGLISPTISATTRSKLLEFTTRRSGARTTATNVEFPTLAIEGIRSQRRLNGRRVIFTLASSALTNHNRPRGLVDEARH